MSRTCIRSALLTLSCLPACITDLMSSLSCSHSLTKRYMSAAKWTVSHWATALPTGHFWRTWPARGRPDYCTCHCNHGPPLKEKARNPEWGSLYRRRCSHQERLPKNRSVRRKLRLYISLCGHRSSQKENAPIRRGQGLHLKTTPQADASRP